jgi:exodeoxyribonuclease-3
MKICTWNVNSLKARAEYVSAFLDEVAPDVLGIQELKLETDKVPREMFEERGYHLAIHGQKQWNGVLIASKTPIEDVHTGLPMGDMGQSRLVACTTAGLRFVNLYCPQGQAVDSPKFTYKLGFFEQLRAWIAEEYSPSDPLVVMGDINIAPKPHDVWNLEKMQGVPTYHPLEHEQWAGLVDWGLHDVVEPHIEPGTFSFWDYRAMSFRFNQGFRIDHVLMTEPLLGRVQGAWVERDWRKKKGDLKASDHAPVVVDFL